MNVPTCILYTGYVYGLVRFAVSLCECDRVLWCTCSQRFRDVRTAQNHRNYGSTRSTKYLQMISRLKDLLGSSSNASTELRPSAQSLTAISLVSCVDPCVTLSVALDCLLFSVIVDANRIPECVINNILCADQQSRVRSIVQ